MRPGARPTFSARRARRFASRGQLENAWIAPIKRKRVYLQRLAYASVCDALRRLPAYVYEPIAPVSSTRSLSGAPDCRCHPRDRKRAEAFSPSSEYVKASLPAAQVSPRLPVNTSRCCRASPLAPQKKRCTRNTDGTWDVRPSLLTLRRLTQLTPAAKHSHRMFADVMPPRLASALLPEMARPQSCCRFRRNCSQRGTSPAPCPQPCRSEMPTPSKSAPTARASRRQPFP